MLSGLAHNRLSQGMGEPLFRRCCQLQQLCRRQLGGHGGNLCDRNFACCECPRFVKHNGIDLGQLFKGAATAHQDAVAGGMVQRPQKGGWNGQADTGDKIQR